MDEPSFDALKRARRRRARTPVARPFPAFGGHVPDDIDVAAVRKASALSQDAFARRIGVAVGTLRNGEQRRRRPEGLARVLLARLERNPRLVEETLGG